jgi:hypothetical protein
MGVWGEDGKKLAQPTFDLLRAVQKDGGIPIQLMLRDAEKIKGIRLYASRWEYVPGHPTAARTETAGSSW